MLAEQTWLANERYLSLSWIAHFSSQSTFGDQGKGKILKDKLPNCEVRCLCNNFLWFQDSSDKKKTARKGHQSGKKVIQVNDSESSTEDSKRKSEEEGFQDYKNTRKGQIMQLEGGFSGLEDFFIYVEVLSKES